MGYKLHYPLNDFSYTKNKESHEISDFLQSSELPQKIKNVETIATYLYSIGIYENIINLLIITLEFAAMLTGRNLAFDCAVRLCSHNSNRIILHHNFSVISRSSRCDLFYQKLLPKQSWGMGHFFTTDTS